MLVENHDNQSYLVYFANLYDGLFYIIDTDKDLSLIEDYLVLLGNCNDNMEPSIDPIDLLDTYNIGTATQLYTLHDFTSSLKIDLKNSLHYQGQAVYQERYIESKEVHNSSVQYENLLKDFVKKYNLNKEQDYDYDI